MAALLKILQKLQKHFTVVSNQGSNKDIFNDFKTDFPVQESDYTQKKLLKMFSLQKQNCSHVILQ